MLGVRKGGVLPLPHRVEWEAEARDCIKTLEAVLGSTAISSDLLSTLPHIAVSLGMELLPAQDA